MGLIKKTLWFAVVAVLALVVAIASRPQSQHAMGVLVAAGLVGAVWLYFGRRDNSAERSGMIYVALTLFGVAVGIGASLVL